MSSVLRFCGGRLKGYQEPGQVLVLHSGGARQREGALLLASEGPKGNMKRR